MVVIKEIFKNYLNPRFFINNISGRIKQINSSKGGKTYK